MSVRLTADKDCERKIPGVCNGAVDAARLDHMRTEQYRWSAEAGWEPHRPPGWLGASAQLVLVFISPGSVPDRSWYQAVRQAYPQAHLFGCSTTGQIHGAAVSQDSVVVTAVAFEHTRVEVARSRISSSDGGYQAGQELGRALKPEGLTHAFTICDAIKTNANDTVSGVNSVLPVSSCLFGGCASNGHKSGETYVICDGPPEAGVIAAVGFYGERLKVGVGSSGGWDRLGLDRLITKSKKNVLYEFDGRPALPLYKKYMGTAAAGLPASGMLFPVSLRIGDSPDGVLRGLLAVNHEEQSLTFAGNVPEGAHARIMFGSTEHLIDGSITAARQIRQAFDPLAPELVIVVSCAARRLILRDRTAEELEGFASVFESRPVMAGFYALGEVAPTAKGGRAEFHNETLTAAALTEV
jgi:hypothetical protein